MPKNKKLALDDPKVLGYFLRKRCLYLIKATVLAQELLNDANKVENWLMTGSYHFDGDSPFEVILRGAGVQVIRFLEERLGRRAGGGF